MQSTTYRALRARSTTPLHYPLVSGEKLRASLEAAETKLAAWFLTDRRGCRGVGDTTRAGKLVLCQLSALAPELQVACRSSRGRCQRRSSAARARMRRHFEFGVARRSCALECTRAHWRAVACVPPPP